MAVTPYPFVSGTVLTASQLNSTFNIPTTTKTASHTLIAADAGTRVIINSASATTITVDTSIFAASDVVEIQNIGAGVCTITAGTATVSSTGSLALAQNGSGRLVFTAAGTSIFQANGISVVSKIAQVVQTVYATATTSTSATYVTTGLNATITPTLASSKVLVMVAGTARNHGTSSEGTWSLFRGTVAGTNLATNASGFLRVFPAVHVGLAINFLDSPSTTSAQIYTLGMKAESGGQSVTWCQSDTTSTMILMEVLA